MSAMSGYSPFASPFGSPLYTQQLENQGYNQQNTSTNKQGSQRGGAGGQLNQFLDRLERTQQKLFQTLDKLSQSLINRLTDLDKRQQEITDKINKDLSERLKNCMKRCDDCTCKLVDQLSSKLAPLLDKAANKLQDTPLLPSFPGSSQAPFTGAEDEDEDGEKEKEKETETETETETPNPYESDLAQDEKGRTPSIPSNYPSSAQDEMKKWADGMYDKGTNARKDKEQLDQYRKKNDCCDLTVQIGQLVNLAINYAKQNPNGWLNMFLKSLSPEPNSPEEEKDREDLQGYWTVLQAAMTVQAPPITYETAESEGTAVIIDYSKLMVDVPKDKTIDPPEPILLLATKPFCVRDGKVIDTAECKEPV